jgi:hypothetical protein
MCACSTAAPDPVVLSVMPLVVIVVNADHLLIADVAVLAQVQATGRAATGRGGASSAWRTVVCP